MASLQDLSVATAIGTDNEPMVRLRLGTEEVYMSPNMAGQFATRIYQTGITAVWQATLVRGLRMSKVPEETIDIILEIVEHETEQEFSK